MNYFSEKWKNIWEWNENEVKKHNNKLSNNVKECWCDVTIKNFCLFLLFDVLIINN